MEDNIVHSKLDDWSYHFVYTDVEPDARVQHPTPMNHEFLPVCPSRRIEGR